MENINYPAPKQEYKVLVRCFTFNHSKYIEDALNGFAMQQTNFPFVCLVVDDASTDGEQDVIKAWMERECDMSRAETIDIPTSVVIIVPHKTNVSCTFAFYLLKQNLYGTGDKKMNHIYPWREKCEYEALCEGDDYWINSLKLQKQVEFLDKNPNCSLCFHNAFYESSKLNKRIGIHKIYSKSQKALQEHIFRDGGFIPTCSILIRITVLEKMYSSSFPSNCPVGDLKIQLYASITGEVFYINETLGVYRLVASSATHKNRNNIKSIVSHHQKFITWYNDVNEFTNRRYSDLIDRSIAFSEARIARAQGNYFIFWNKRYWNYLNSLKITTRIGIIIGMFGLTFISKFGKLILSKIKGL